MTELCMFQCMLPGWTCVTQVQDPAYWWTLVTTSWFTHLIIQLADIQTKLNVISTYPHLMANACQYVSIWCVINHLMNESIDGSVHPPSWRNDLINQSINQSINQLINQSINQSINQLINQLINQSFDQSINRSINQSISSSKKSQKAGTVLSYPILDHSFFVRIGSLIGQV